MDYLCRRLNIQAKFMISVHDEIRFLVKQEHELLAAFALQISNLWVRSLFVYQVGMKDLPLVTFL
jgi:DNA polymerase gamma 1